MQSNGQNGISGYQVHALARSGRRLYSERVYSLNRCYKLGSDLLNERKVGSIEVTGSKEAVLYHMKRGSYRRRPRRVSWRLIAELVGIALIIWLGNDEFQAWLWPEPHLARILNTHGPVWSNHT